MEHPPILSPSCSPSSTTAPTYPPPSHYKSILWDGKLGSLLLHDKRIVFAGLSGITEIIPFYLVESHQLAPDSSEVDLTLTLRNGQSIELLFSDSQELPQVQQDIAHRLQLCKLEMQAKALATSTTSNSTNTNTQTDHEPQSSACCASASAQLQQPTSSDHTQAPENQAQSLLKEVEEDMQIAHPDSTLFSSTHSADNDLEMENLNLRESLTSLLDKVGQLEGQLSWQENQHRTVMGTLETQFQRLRRDLLGKPGKPAATALIGTQQEEVELVHWSPTATTSPNNNNDNNNNKPEHSMLASTNTQGDHEEVQLERAMPNQNTAATNDTTAGGIPLPVPDLFTVRESVATEEGLNLIRRKLNLRASSVTGHRAYAKTLPSDTYSFLMVTPACSVPFFMGVVVWILQTVTFLLMAISIIEEKLYENNPIGIPPNVDTEVRVVQFIAIVICVVTQDDLMKGLDLIRIRKSRSFLEAYPHSSLFKVYAAITVRCMQGCLGMVASFLLIITSDTIYYLLLNFTALEFITQLDEGFFVLCDYGFAGKTCEVAVKAINTTTYYVHTRIYRMRKIFLFTLIGVIMLGGWATIVYKQKNGHYLCQTIQVQFGDDLRPELGTFSGLYGQVRNKGSAIKHIVSDDNYLRYVDEASSTAVFAYCKSEGYWTFQYSNDVSIDDLDPCENWVVRSPTTEAYDIVYLNTQRWIVRNNLNREIFLKPFTLRCHDCGSTHNDCSGRGICSNAICECEEGFYGMECQFSFPCGKLQMDSRFQGFQGTRDWSQIFYLFKLNDVIVNSYERPVYFYDYGDLTYDVMFFTGRRWGVAYSTELASFYDRSVNGTKEARLHLADYFESYSAHWANLSLGFMSEPMDLLTPIDSQSPVGLEFFSAIDKVEDQTTIQTPDLVSPVAARLLCAVCDESTNPCLYSGTCTSRGQCQCQPGSTGALCEQPPLANGRCDPFLNTPQYGFDGGDCCGNTCVSGLASCGRDDTGFGYIGYECKQPENEWQRVGNGIHGEDGALVGNSVAISRSGNFLVVGTPGANKVLAYDRKGSEWVRRGSSLSGKESSSLGEHVKLASGSFSLWNTPEFLAPYTFAVRAPGEGNSTVIVVRCGNDEDGCQEHVRFDQYHAFDISDNGDFIALGQHLVYDDLYMNKPKVIIASLNEVSSIYTGEHTKNHEVIEPVYMEPPHDSRSRNFTQYAISSISLSRDGETMAIQTQTDDNDYRIAECIELTEYAASTDDRGCEARYITNSVVGRGNQTAVLMQQNASMDFSTTRPIVISANSRVVAYAALDDCAESAMAHVWEFNDERWVQRLPELPPIQVEKCTSDFAEKPMSLDLTEDGMAIAVGYSGIVEVFEYDFKKWRRIGDATPENLQMWVGEELLTSVSLASDDASVLAVGVPGTDVISGGLAQVIERVLPNNGCGRNEKKLHLSLTTDSNPHSLSWSVFDNSTQEVRSVEAGFYQYSWATHVQDVCISDSNCTIFTIYDHSSVSGYSSLFPPGRFDLLVDQTKTAQGGFSGAAKRIFIGDECLTCSGGLGLFQVYLRTCEVVGWELVDNTGSQIFRTIPRSGVTVHDNETMAPSTCEWETYWEDVCINFEENCYVFYVYVVKHPNADDYYAQTEYSLFYNDEEIHHEDVLTDGQTSFFVGNCSKSTRRP